MRISLIVAVSSNNIIGDGGKLPWRLSGDMRRFKELTMSHAVVMGRKTFESLPDQYRPLPQRLNVVVSRGMECAPGVLVARSLQEALDVAADKLPCASRIFVIGGEQVYRDAIALAHEIFLTRVEDQVSGDARFPLFSHKDWKEVERSELMFENDFEYRFLKYERGTTG